MFIKKMLGNCSNLDKSAMDLCCCSYISHKLEHIFLFETSSSVHDHIPELTLVIFHKHLAWILLYQRVSLMSELALDEALLLHWGGVRWSWVKEAGLHQADPITLFLAEALALHHFWQGFACFNFLKCDVDNLSLSSRRQMRCECLYSATLSSCPEICTEHFKVHLRVPEMALVVWYCLY